MQKVTDIKLNIAFKTGMKVFVRCDIDVPLKDGEILETFRLEALLPTLNFLKQHNTKIIIAGHIGRPKGKYIEELSTKHLAPYFSEKLGKNNYELLENLRFDVREEQNDTSFARELAQNADIYVNESFATCHKNHASIASVPKILPSYAGIRLSQEVLTLERVIKKPQRPLVIIIGGAKIETKKPVITNFLKIADEILVGGKIALEWKDSVPDKVILPVDFVDDKDIGTKTIGVFKEKIRAAKTIVWAGPLGIYEEEKYTNGTREITQAIIKSGAFSIVGGGDTITAIKKSADLSKFSFVSTGGSAMLGFLANETLPGLEAIGYTKE